MGGVTIWIIIGTLVGAVAIFLIVMSIKDRKKAKKLKAEEAEIKKKSEEGGIHTILLLLEVNNQNNKLLAKFVPSVGKIKMGDIRAKAKKVLLDFKSTETYKLANDLEENEKIMKIFNKFEKENSNSWTKKLASEIKFLQEESKKIKKEFKNEHLEEINLLVKEEYK